MRNFKFDMISLNTRGLKSDSDKRNAIFNWLKTTVGNDRTVCYLQETHSIEACEQSWYCEWGADVYFAHGTSDSRGVAILMPKDVEVQVSQQIKDVNGRYILLDCLIEGTRFVFLNVYAPTKNHVIQQ